MGAERADQDMWMQGHADRHFKQHAGKPYRPSNGSEGEMFAEMWCNRCQRDAAFRADPDKADGCWIFAATMAYSADDPEYPKEWQYSPRGQPVCTAFEPESDRS